MVADSWREFCPRKNLCSGNHLSKFNRPGSTSLTVLICWSCLWLCWVPSWWLLWSCSSSWYLWLLISFPCLSSPLFAFCSEVWPCLLSRLGARWCLFIEYRSKISPKSIWQCCVVWIVATSLMLWSRPEMLCTWADDTLSTCMWFDLRAMQMQSFQVVYNCNQAIWIPCMGHIAVKDCFPICSF